MLIYPYKGKELFLPKMDKYAKLYKNNFEHKSFRRQDLEILIHHYVISFATFKNVLEKYSKIFNT